MSILYFNDNGKRVSIGIAGDHQLTGNRLCHGCSVAKSSVGWINLLWPQGAQVKTQLNSIISVVQMRDNGCLVDNFAIHKMREIDREEWMTTKNTWDSSKLDNVEGTTERLLKQFLPTPMDATDSFYNSQCDIRTTKSDLEVHPAVIGDIRATKSDLEIDPAVSDAPGESSQKRGDRYHPKPSGNKSEEYQ